MANQFKHESDDYIPLLDNGKIYIRPDWMSYDELFVDFVNPLNKNDIMQKFVKINSLTKEEFIKYQKAGRIPADYKIEEWIKC
ncbi:hypothetical protein WKT05_08935 [Peptoniphilus sp. HCN-40583]